MAPSSADEPQEAAKATAQHEPEPADRTLSGVKRKEMEPRKRPSFKAIGHLVMAMRRFTDSLNPTYTYGKRTTSSSGGGSKLVSEDVEAAAVTSAEKNRPLSKGRAPTPDGHEPVKYAYSSHGHKFDFLLKPLPRSEEEEAVR